MSADTKQLKALGWAARKGSYVGTTDDRADRWYIAHDSEAFRPLGPGYRTRAEAWAAIAERATQQP